MALRCFLFTEDLETSEPICTVLADLGIEGEHCAEAVDAVAQVTQQPYQIVIIDWDAQPEAALLLKACRERKASERPLTLAVVSEDESGPQALQAGANSILRRPILANQVKDTLTTARDLLRARENAAQGLAAAAAATAPTALPASMTPAGEKTLRAGEFLQSSPTAPGGQFETESDVPALANQDSSEPIDALKELEPMAAAVPEKPIIAPSSDTESEEPRGLQWYLNKRAGGAPPQPVTAPAAPASSTSTGPDLLGFDQMVSQPAPRREPAIEPRDSAAVDRGAITSDPKQDAKEEAQLFAYVTGVGEEAKEKAPRSFPLGKGTIIGALALAACAIVAAPQAPWHGKIRALWGQGRQALHAWLNPQPVTTVAQAPAAHEDFARAGDEYKLPVAENIPDATTDPSQIRVTPVVDPTAKKIDNGANADPNAAGDAGSGAAGVPVSGTQPQAAATDVQPTPTTVPPNSATTGTDGGPTAAATPQLTVAPSAAPSDPPPVDTPAVNSPPSNPPAAAQPAVPGKSDPPAAKPAQVHVVAATGNPPIPSSLTTQIGSMTPEASGNKPPETALDSIEPVNVPEAAERALATAQPAIAYPETAKGQQGTVILQVLVGRDGTVEDAKFLQGSLAFARAAIDGVKQWKFKPYIMNGRPVSVTTKLTMSFQPGS